MKREINCGMFVSIFGKFAEYGKYPQKRDVSWH
jgi:hypothetical protein